MTSLLERIGWAVVDTTEVDVEGGSTTLDAAAVPYVSADLVLPLLDDDLLEWLDPRAPGGRRVPYTAGLEGIGTRSFDLGLRGRRVDHEAKSVTLTLASDEALLMGYRTLVSDNGARAHETSLRAVCDYVLGKIGASLEAGTDDADVTAYWAVTNVLPDPVCNSLASFTANGNATLGAVITDANSPLGKAFYWTSGAAGQSFVRTAARQPARRGQTWTFLARMRRGAGAGATGFLRVNERDAAGNVVRRVDTPNVVLSDTAAFTPLALTFTVEHPATVDIEVNMAANASGGGQTYAACVPMLYEGNEPIPPFSGSSVGGGYTYSWAGPVNNSPSTRTPLVERRPELFVWKPGMSAWDFLLAITASAGLVLWCDEQRAWRLALPENRTIVHLVAVTTGNTSAGTDAIDLGDDETTPTGVIVHYTWTDADGIRREAFDTAGAPERAVTIPMDAAYPGPGMAAAILARRQGSGRRQDVTCITQVDTTPGMAAQISLPGAPTTAGKVQSVTFDHNTGFMTLGMAGLIDIMPGSVDALVGSVDALVGTVDSL